MVPDILIHGQWVDWFLIYWASCYFGFFLISWVTMGLRPDMWDWSIYISVITRSLWLPILLPVKTYIYWRNKKRLAAINKEMKEDGTFERMGQHMQVDNSLRAASMPMEEITLEQAQQNYRDSHGPIVRPMNPIPFAPPMPPPIADGDEFAKELEYAWEAYMERLGEIEVERHHREQSRLEDRGAPTGA